MASSQDTASRKYGNDESGTTNNHAIAMAQGEKTAFRAQKVAISADPFASGRLPIQEDRY